MNAPYGVNVFMYCVHFDVFFHAWKCSVRVCIWTSAFICLGLPPNSTICTLKNMMAEQSIKRIENIGMRALLISLWKQKHNINHIFLIRDMAVKRCYRRFYCETIYIPHKSWLQFLPNALRDNMGMIIFGLKGCGGC